MGLFNKQTHVEILTTKFKSGRKSDQSCTKIVQDRGGENYRESIRSEAWSEAIFINANR